MDINKDTGKYSKTITVMVQTTRTGPWEPISIQIDPEAFLNAKSKARYICNLASEHLMGMDVISVDFKYSEKDAKIDLGSN